MATGTEPKRIALVRDIRSAGISLIVLNAMIGAGIFSLPAEVAALAGGLSPWMFLGVGALFITIVLTFAELTSYFRESGGPALYTVTAFGPFAGFSTGWMFYVGRVTSFAANTTAMAAYLGALWPSIATGTGRAAFIIIFCAALTIANYLGVKDGVRTVMVFTLFKLTPIVLLVLLGMREVTGDTLLPSQLPAIESFGELSLLIIYAFIGFETATFVSGETKRPRRTLPRAIVATVIGVAVLYFLIMLVYVSVLPIDARQGASLADVGERLIGHWGGLIIAIAAVFSIGGNLAASMLSAPRLPYALGEQRMLPAWFAQIHPRHATPGNAILLHGSLCLLLALSGTFAFLAIATSLTRLITYALSILALPKIRNSVDAETREQAYRLKGGFTVPLMALAMCVWVGAHAPFDAWLMTGALLLLGFVLYWFARRRIRDSGQRTLDI